MARSIMLASDRSGNGKTMITTAILSALALRGRNVVAAKAGPDYLDLQFHSSALSKFSRRSDNHGFQNHGFQNRRSDNRGVYGRIGNLDAFAMSREQLRARAHELAVDHDLLVVEGSMGLFDEASLRGPHASGSSADVARALSSPIVLVLNAAGQGATLAAVAAGLHGFSSNINVAGVILNRVASARHEALLRRACHSAKIEILGVVARQESLLSSRHLGLVQPTEVAGLDDFLQRMAELATSCIDLDRLESLAVVLPPPSHLSSPKHPPTQSHLPSPKHLPTQSHLPSPKHLPTQSHLPSPKHLPTQSHATCQTAASWRTKPLGGAIAIAYDEAFSFIYDHQLRDWHQQGADLSFFSPLANEVPDGNCDAIFLPGGYPELHLEKLKAAPTTRHAILAAAQRGVVIYGECGGYMYLGREIVDADGKRYEGLGLLAATTSFAVRGLNLGYRNVVVRSKCALGDVGDRYLAHEFHYSTETSPNAHEKSPLFRDSAGSQHGGVQYGDVRGSVFGSYLHVISPSDLPTD